MMQHTGMAAMAMMAAFVASSSGATVTAPAQVNVLGHSRAMLEAGYDRLCAPPLNDLDFVLSDVSFKYTRRFTEYSGDVSGRWLGAMVAGGPVLGRDAAMVGQLCEALGTYRKADGHFGVEQNLAAGLKPEQDMPILWGNGRLLLALVQRYQQTKELDVLKLARGIGDYMVETRKYFGKPENLKLNGAYAAGYTTCYPSTIEGLALLAEVTQESKYLEEARFIAGIALMDKSFEAHHSHGRLAAYRGMLETDRVGKTAEFVSAVQAGVDKVANELMLPTGGVTEVFDLAYARDEGCSETDWIMSNVLLWRATGETKYLDLAEFALRNHVGAAQFANGGFGHHTLRATKTAKGSFPAGGFAPIGAEAYWCCSMHGVQLLGDVAHYGVVGGDSSAVCVTWLAEVSTKLPCDGHPITVAVTQTAPDAWQIQLQANGTANVPVRLRVPAWCEQLTVDGTAVAAKNGWAEVLCKIAGEKTLNVQFAKNVRILGAYHDKPIADEPQRLAAGLDLYCLPDAGIPEDFVATDAVPTVWVAAQAAEDGRIPVVVEGGKSGTERIATQLVPMRGRPVGGCRWFFNVRTTETLPSAATFENHDVPVELVFACDGECDVFVNGKLTEHRKGWGENWRTELYVPRGSCVVAVKAQNAGKPPAIIGWVRCGKKIVVTDEKAFSAVSTPANMPADWLTDPSQGNDRKTALTNLGGFGIEPARQMPAEFAGTQSQWIRPTVAASPSQPTQGSWLFRCSFDVP